jgi:cytochrome b561
MPSTESLYYTRTAKVLHWLIAATILFMLMLGWSFDYLPKGETKFFFFQLHKSIGITILMLSLVRLCWRLLHAAPPLPTSMPAWEQRAAHIGHFFLYAAMIGVPVSGWAMVSAHVPAMPTILFGVVHWPSFPILATLENRKEIGEALENAHGLGATVLAILVAGHVAAALKHHFIARDDILLRMAPRSFSGFLNRLRKRA